MASLRSELLGLPAIALSALNHSAIRAGPAPSAPARRVKTERADRALLVIGYCLLADPEWMPRTSEWWVTEAENPETQKIEILNCVES